MFKKKTNKYAFFIIIITFLLLEKKKICEIRKEEKGRLGRRGKKNYQVGGIMVYNREKKVK